MIPYLPEPHRATDDASFMRTLATAIPRTYAIVFYSTNVRFGWCLALLSLMVRGVGLAGLLAVVASAGLAWVLNAERSSIRSGFLLFNPMLSCSSMALLAKVNGWAPPTLLLLCAATIPLSMALTISLQGWVASKIGISVQSVPAVLTAMLLSWSGHSSAGYGPQVDLSTLIPGDWIELPSYLSAFFKSFASIAFQETVLAGMLMYAAFAIASPLGALMATVGYASGACAFAVLGLPPDPSTIAWCGFNFLLAGIALGAGYQVPNRSSLCLAAIGGATVALVSLSLYTVMGALKLSPGALPYNLVVIATVAAIRLLPRPNPLVSSPWIVLQPEGAARISQITEKRFPYYNQPAIFLPIGGTSVVTQSFGGHLTHRGSWMHALDFETSGFFGTWNPSSPLPGEYGIFGRPVHSPCSGVVVSMESQVEDNAIGGNNPEKNWGNHVILLSDAGNYVLLAHFKKGSLAVSEGQRVKEGEYLAQVGNSGRSPLPHLHAHVQSGPLLGSPTVPFALKHYVEISGDSRPSYRTAGVPSKGCVVRPAAPSPSLYNSLSGWLPGNYRYKSTHRAHDLRLDFDEAGRYRMSSPTSRESITFFLSEGVMYSSTFGGISDELLPLLGIALARIPCIDEPEVEWDDFVPAVSFMGGWRKWVHDLLDPFTSPAVLRYKYAVRAERGDHLVLAELAAESSGVVAALAPKRLEGKISGRSGVVLLRGTRCNGIEFEYELDR